MLEHVAVSTVYRPCSRFSARFQTVCNIERTQVSLDSALEWLKQMYACYYREKHSYALTFVRVPVCTALYTSSR